MKDWVELTADLEGNGEPGTFTDEAVEQGATHYFYRIRQK
jgi:hypothetical protein